MSNVCPWYVYTGGMNAAEPPEHHLRIGQLAGRVGVSATLLRAWERRYGLLEPVRTHHGYRLYSAEDEARVRSMLALITDGVAPQQAARMVISGTAPAAVARAGDASPAARPRAPRGGARALRRRRGQRRLRRAARAVHGQDGALRRCRSVPCRPRRPVGARRGDDRAGTLREQPAPRAPARPCPRLGRGRWAACPPGMSERRASRSRPHLLRDRPSRPRLADHLPGRRHPSGDPVRGRGRPRTEHHRAGGDEDAAPASARRRGTKFSGADRRCGKRGYAQGRGRARRCAARRRSGHRRRSGSGGDAMTPLTRNR